METDRHSAEQRGVSDLDLPDPVTVLRAQDQTDDPRPREDRRGAGLLRRADAGGYGVGRSPGGARAAQPVRGGHRPAFRGRGADERGDRGAGWHDGRRRPVQAFPEPDKDEELSGGVIQNDGTGQQGSGIHPE